MTIELALCLLFAVFAFPVSRSISAHYLMFAVVNYALLGFEFADSSLLAMLFVFMAVVDSSLVIAGGRMVLLISAAASASLAIEAMLNLSWLLDHSTYLSAAVNAVIGVYLAREYWLWTKSK